jgi:hypothetical protein
VTKEFHSCYKIFGARRRIQSMDKAYKTAE